MQVKRYVAPNMRLALKMVREEIGPDAVILSSKRLADGVEILTSAEVPAVPAAVTSALAAGSDTATGADQPLRDNPFRDASQSEAAPRELGSTIVRAAAQRRASPLERELEQMHRDTRQRARALADSYARKQTEFRQQAEQHYASVAAAATQVAADPAPDVVQLSTVAPPPVQPVVAAEAVVDGEMAQMRQELQSMRDMLEQQLSTIAWGSYRQQHPLQASLWRRMKRMGLSAAIAHELLAGLPQASPDGERKLWQALMAKLAARLPVLGRDIVDEGGVFALVGPTGAGKTTTIGKLATRYVLQHGADSVALVTTDTARIAAYEQLRTFGRILNVPVKVADSHHSLEQILLSLRHKRLVLVDTAGFNSRDQRLTEQLRAINEVSGRVKTLLTIPATSQLSVIKAAYHAFRTENLAGCILTKLDEAASIGEILSLAAEKQLPLAYIADGQNVPDNIAVAAAPGLIRTAISLARGVATDDSAMAEEVQSLARA